MMTPARHVVAVGIERDGSELTIALRTADKTGVVFVTNASGASCIAAVLASATTRDAADTSSNFEMHLRGCLTFVEPKKCR